MAGRSRPGADEHHHVGQHRLRVPCGRPVDHAPHVRDGGRQERCDRCPCQLPRPRRLRSALHRHEARGARRCGRVPARCTRRVRAGRRIEDQLCQTPRRSVQHHRSPRRASRSRRQRRASLRPQVAAPRPSGHRQCDRARRRKARADVHLRGLRRSWLHRGGHADPAQPAGRAADGRRRRGQAGRRRRGPWIASICIHSDTPGAATLGAAVAVGLLQAGYELRPFTK